MIPIKAAVQARSGAPPLPPSMLSQKRGKYGSQPLAGRVSLATHWSLSEFPSRLIQYES